MAEQKRLADGRPRRQSGKAARCEHTKRWFILPILTPGGGGWGDPLARLPEWVRCDVVRGLVSPASARADYGVVVVPAAGVGMAAWAVDEAATAALRAERRAARPPLKMINRGEYAERLLAEGRITVSDADYPASFDEAAYLAAATAA